MPRTRTAATRDPASTPLPGSDVEDAAGEGDGILGTPLREESPISAQTVDFGLTVFLAAVLAVETPVSSEGMAATIALVVRATAAAIQLPPHGVLAPLVTALGWGGDAFDPEENAVQLVTSSRSLEDRLSQHAHVPRTTGTPVPSQPSPSLGTRTTRPRGPDLKGMPDFTLKTPWSFFEKVETLYKRYGIHEHLSSHSPGAGEDVAYSTLRLSLHGAMVPLATKNTTTTALWPAMKEKLQPETASNAYVLRAALGSLAPPTTGTDYDNLGTYFDAYDSAETQAIEICGSSFIVTDADRLHHYRTAIPSDLLRAQPILLMQITDPQQLRKTLLQSTRPLVTGAAVAAVATHLPALSASFNSKDTKPPKKGEKSCNYKWHTSMLESRAPVPGHTIDECNLKANIEKGPSYQPTLVNGKWKQKYKHKAGSKSGKSKQQTGYKHGKTGWKPKSAVAAAASASEKPKLCRACGEPGHTESACGHKIKAGADAKREIAKHAALAEIDAAYGTGERGVVAGAATSHPQPPPPAPPPPPQPKPNRFSFFAATIAMLPFFMGALALPAAAAVGIPKHRYDRLEPAAPAGGILTHHCGRLEPASCSTVGEQLFNLLSPTCHGPFLPDVALLATDQACVALDARLSVFDNGAPVGVIPAREVERQPHRYHEWPGSAHILAGMPAVAFGGGATTPLKRLVGEHRWARARDGAKHCKTFGPYGVAPDGPFTLCSAHYHLQQNNARTVQTSKSMNIAYPATASSPAHVVDLVRTDANLYVLPPPCDPPHVAAANAQQDLIHMSVALGASQPPSLTHRQTVTLFLQAPSIPLGVALQQAKAYSSLHEQAQAADDHKRGIQRPTVAAQEIHARIGWRGRHVVHEFAQRAGIRTTGTNKSMGPAGLTGRARQSQASSKRRQVDQKPVLTGAGRPHHRLRHHV